MWLVLSAVLLRVRSTRCACLLCLPVLQTPPLFTLQAACSRRRSPQMSLLMRSWPSTPTPLLHINPLCLLLLCLPVLQTPFSLLHPAGSLLTQKITTDELADAFMAFNTN
jgi:hypothetical protein